MSTPENKYLEILRGGSPSPEDVSEEDRGLEENKYFQLLRGSVAARKPREEPVTPAPGRFIRGVGRATVRPVRAFSEFLPGDAEKGEEEERDLGIAGTLGELVGMGATFIPLYRGASAVLKGVGLLRTSAALGGRAAYLTPLGRTAAGVRGAEIAKGSLAFAGFETFAGESIEEAPKRLARGLLEGAAFEVAAAGVATKWRSLAKAKRWSKTVTTEKRAFEDTEVYADPLAVGFEQAANPGISRGEAKELVEGRVRAIMESKGSEVPLRREWRLLPEDQWVKTKVDGKTRTVKHGYVFNKDPKTAAQESLAESFTRFVTDYMPGGQVLLPGMSKKEVSKLARLASEKGNMEFSVFRRIEGEDLFDLWLVDKNRSVLSAERLPGGVGTTSEFTQAIRQTYAKQGIDLNDVPVIEFPTETIITKKGKALGLYTPRVSTRPPRIKTVVKPGEDPEALEKTMTLLHEFTHHVWYSRALRERGSKYWTEKRKPDLEDLFGRFLREDVGIPEKEIPDYLAGIKEELQGATEALLTKEHEAWGLSYERALKAARKAIKKKVDYYHEDTELASRMAELMALDPEAAKRIAPSASKIVGNLIREESPLVRDLMTREQAMMSDIMNELWRRVEGGPITVFTRGRPKASPGNMEEFGRTGWAPGFRALVDGKMYEFVGKAAGTKGKKAYVRSLDDGTEMLVDTNQLSRPALQDVVKRNEEVIGAIDGMLDEFPQRIPINIVDDVPGGGAQEVAGGLRRAHIDVADYEVISSDIPAWISGLPRKIQETLIAKHGQLRPPTMDRLRKPPGLPTDRQRFTEGPVALVNDALELLGKKGIVRRDSGDILGIYAKDRDTIVMSPVQEAFGFGSRVAGGMDSLVFTPHVDDWLKYQLREKGVAETDLEYFLGIARERFGRKLRGVMDAEVKQADENVKVAVKKQKRTAKSAEEASLENQGTIARAGIETERIPDGRLLLRDSESKSILAKVANEDEAVQYAVERGPKQGDDFVNPPGAAGHGGDTHPPKPNDPGFPSPDPLVSQPGPKGARGKLKGIRKKLIDSVNLAAPWTVALENFARSAERNGYGPAYNQVYRVAFNAMKKVQNELSVVTRDKLGGLTFKDKLEELGRGLSSVSKKRFPVVQGYVEAISKDEIKKAGGLMQRAMTKGELNAARKIEAFGLEHDVPRLMSTNTLINSALRGDLSETLRKMKRIELSPEVRTKVLPYFEKLPKFKNRKEVMEHLGLTQEEREVLRIIQDSFKASKDKFSISAVSRYASAPKLKKGFKNGREMYAYENKMKSAELRLAGLMDETLEAGFEASGLDAKRQLSGYFPHVRKLVREGNVDFERYIGKENAKWFANRFRSGELNVYEENPYIATYKYLRGLYMEKHFDKVMPQIEAGLKAIENVDDQTHRVMSEYVQELMGKPHASFEKLQQSIEKIVSILTGGKVPERLASDVVSGLTAVASAAALPFRPALIARNFVESFLKVSPRVGIDYYLKGLRYVTSRETRVSAYKDALKAGAIRPGMSRLRSIHAVEDVFGARSPRVMDRWLRLFDKGFEWYQSADDWGRAVAYHSQRLRFQDKLGVYQRGKGTVDDLERLLSDAKVNTYDPLDVDIVRDHLRNNNFDKAVDHLGLKLSNETMVRYGYADHPHGWNSVPGRLFGQFGTWPVQYKDYLLQGVSRGSAKDKIEFATTHIAASGAIVTAGASVGVDLKNWVGSTNMYTGGPYAEMFVDVIKSLGGSDTEKALARRNLIAQVPVWGFMETGTPRSIFLPGSYLLADLQGAKEAFKNEDFFEGVMTGAGVNVLRPDEQTPLDFFGKF